MNDESTDAFINVENLTVSYDNQKLALAGVDLKVAAKEFVAILGPSGCGKSTLLQALSGLLPPRSGKAEIAGRDVTSSVGSSAAIGYVFQDHRLLPWRTVSRNLEIVLSAAEVPKIEWDVRIDRYLNLLQVRDFRDSWPLRLSGGQRQRVSIARALAIEPAVIFMDEPFSTLDEVTARQMRQHLSTLHEENPRAVLFVTHSIREAVYLADKILILTRGPATVLEEVVVPFERPRNYEDPALAEFERMIVGRVMSVWGDDNLPETP